MGAGVRVNTYWWIVLGFSIWLVLVAVIWVLFIGAEIRRGGPL
jgi:hypothetical protein